MEENVGLKLLPAKHQEMVEHLEQIHGLRVAALAWFRADEHLRKKRQYQDIGDPPLREMKDLLNDACKVLIHDREEAISEAENLLSRSLVEYSEIVREKDRQSRTWCSYISKELNYLVAKLLKSIDLSLPIIPASDSLPKNSKDMISCCQKLVTALKLRQSDDVPSLLKEFHECLYTFHMRLFNKLSKFCTVVGLKHVDKVQIRVSGIPAPWLERSVESKDITTFRSHLCGMVQGHASVIDKITNTLFSPVLKPKGYRPWAFLFLGQSGTGMGQLAKAISTHLFCSQLVKLDMSEATPEKLVDSVRKKPYCLIHLKSIEKASSSVMDSIITILTYRNLIDEDGCEVDFTKTMLIMTSNVGADQLVSRCPFYSRNVQHSRNEHVCSTSCRATERVLREAKKTFDSVMLNHLDGIHVFSETCTEVILARVVMRDMAMSVTNNPIAIYPSECALNAVLSSARSSTSNASCTNGHVLKGWLLENVFPVLQSNYVNCNYKGFSAVYIDTFVGTKELCYRKELHGTLLEDFFLKKYAMSWRKLKAIHMGERQVYKQLVMLREKWSNPVVCIQFDEMEGYNQDFIHLLESFLRSMYSLLDISNEALPKQVTYRELDKEEIQVWSRKSGYRRRGRNFALDIIMEAIYRSTKATADLPFQPSSTYLLLGFDSDKRMGIMTGLLKELSFSRRLSVIYIDMSKDDFVTRLFEAGNPCVGGIISVLPSIIDVVQAWPHCVIFFDKVEKASPSDYSYLLRILDTGVLDSRGYMVDFRRTVIVLNSDLGRKERIAEIFLGPNLKTAMDDVEQGEESRFRSELLGRVDEVVMANPPSSRREIARVHLKDDQLLRMSSNPAWLFFSHHIFEKNLRSRRLDGFLIETLKFYLSVKIEKGPVVILD